MMGGSVKEWVDQYAATIDDATSLRIMRGRAFGGAYQELYLLNTLDADDPWVPILKKIRDEYIDCIDRIEARLNELGAPYGSERHYCMNAAQINLVEDYRRSLNG